MAAVSVEHAYNPSTWEAGTEDKEFKGSLHYIVRPCQTKK